MGTAGDDLKKYLIIPSSPPGSSPFSFSNPAFPHTTKSRASISSLAAEAEHTRANVRDSTDKAEESNMEIDTPAQPPMSSSAHTEQKAMTSAAPPTGIVSMEDFMKQYQEEHQAQREERRAAPSANKAKTSENATLPTPIVVGARSSKHTILLHEKYQALGIPQPLFTYEGGSIVGWSASVSFPGLDDAEELQGLSVDRKFNSKQEAKEALSQKTMAVLEELEKEGRVKKAGKGRKASVGGSLEQQKDDVEENYIGKLLGTYTCSV
jgi:hypothetical protein